jgi:hypothetical protein
LRILPRQPRQQDREGWARGWSVGDPYEGPALSFQRRNDISQQMRNIARAIIPQEIEEAAAYYALCIAAAGDRESDGLMAGRKSRRGPLLDNRPSV